MTAYRFVQANNAI